MIIGYKTWSYNRDQRVRRSASPRLMGSESISFTLNTCQATFIIDIYDTTAGIGKNATVMYPYTEGQTNVKPEIVI